MPTSFVFYNPFKDKKIAHTEVRSNKNFISLNFDSKGFENNIESVATSIDESLSNASFEVVKTRVSKNTLSEYLDKESSPCLVNGEDDSSRSFSIGDSPNWTETSTLESPIPMANEIDNCAQLEISIAPKEFCSVPSITKWFDKLGLGVQSPELNASSQSTPFEAMCLYEEYITTLMLRDNLRAELNFQPLTWFSSGKGRLLYAFAHGFVASISPQFCHEDLTPGAIFISQGQGNPFMMEVFLACGLAFMSNVHSSYQAESRKAYSLCLSRFANELAQVKEPKEWMIAAMLLFCLRDKIIGELPVQAAMHLSEAINHIDFVFKSQSFDAKNIKFMVESFLFNYSVLLLVGGKKVHNILPSPFLIFDKWRRLLHMQMFSCVVPWMNNPVFGAAADAFEIAAKISWLVSEHPLSSDQITIACDLLLELGEIDSFSGVSIPDHIVEAGRQHLQDSRLLSKVIVVACKIALYKLMNPSLNERNPKIKMLAQEGFELIEQIPLKSPVNVIMGWPVLIIGLCLIDLDQQLSLSKRCIYVSEVSCVAFLRQVERFLDRIWTSSEVRENGNLDHLFEELGSMCL